LGIEATSAVFIGRHSWGTAIDPKTSGKPLATIAYRYTGSHDKQQLAAGAARSMVVLVG